MQIIGINNASRLRDNYWQKASLIFSYRKINPFATKWGRIVRGTDFAETDIGFYNGWADFGAIQAFSQGGEVRLVGNTGQGIAYDFTQTTYVGCAGIMDTNGNFYYDKWGNHTFNIGSNNGQSHSNGTWYDTPYNIFQVSQQKIIQFAFLLDDEPQNNVCFFISKATDGINRYNIITSTIRPGEIASNVTGNGGTTLAVIAPLTDAYFYQLNDNIKIAFLNEYSDTYSANFTASNSDLSVLRLFWTANPGQNGRSWFGTVTELIGWHTIDLQPKNLEIRNELKSIYNV